MSLAGGGYRLGTSQVSSRAWSHDHAALQIRSAALQKSRLSLGKQSGRWGSYLAMQPSQTTCCTLAARSMPISNTLSHAMLGPRSHISRAAALHRYVARPLSAAALERSFHAIEAQIPSASSSRQVSDVLLSAAESEIHLSEASGKTEMSYCCLIPRCRFRAAVSGPKCAIAHFRRGAGWLRNGSSASRRWRRPGPFPAGAPPRHPRPRGPWDTSGQAPGPRTPALN